MKKVLTLLLTITALTFGLLTVTSCTPSEPHTHAVTFVEAQESTCSENGNIAHYVCSCGKKFEDLNATIEITLVASPLNPNNHVSLTFKPQTNATCVSLASVEHYACSGCNKLYSDQLATNEILQSDIYFGELGTHVNVEFQPASAPKCNGELGNYEHFKCLDCHKLSLTEDFSKEVEEFDVIDSSSPPIHANAIKTPEVKATCNSYGVKEYYRCEGCSNLFLDEFLTMRTYEGSYELVLEYDYSNHPSLNFIPGVKATCMQSGVKDYYECVSCYRKFEDQTGTIEIFNDSDLFLPNTSHNATFYPEQTPSCKNGFVGHMPYYYCGDCGQNYDSPDSSLPIYDFNYNGDLYDVNCHELTFVDAKKQTCVQDGNSVYFYCDCGAYFDEWNYYYSTPEQFFVGYEKNEYSHSLIYLAPKSADCKQGNIECYKCEYCSTYYSLSVDPMMPSPEYIIDKSQAIIPSTGRHNLTEYAYIAPTCTQSGKSAHWKCTSCLKYFRDEAGLNEMDECLITLAPTGHSFTHYDYTPSTCLTQGNIAYSHCKNCNKDFNLVSSPIEDVTGSTLLPLSGHDTTFIEGISATCTESGVKNSNLCSVCNKHFENDLTTEITNLVIPATGHSYEEKWSYDETSHWHEANCGHDVTSEHISHNLDGYKIITPSTCTAKGVAQVYCTDCERVNNAVEVELKNHVYILVPTVDSTCASAGVSEHYTCFNCDNWFDADKNIQDKSYFEIPLSSDKHDYKTESVNGTCQQQGYTKKTCSICNDEQITYNGYGYCSFKFTSLDDYYHQSICIYCGNENGEKQSHNINNSNHCGICGEEFDFVTYLNYNVGRIDNTSTQYAFITGITSQTVLGSELKIPSMIGTYQVYSIEDYAFDNYLITSLYIPESVRQIGSNAFKNCTSLESVYFTGNSKLQVIGGSAFENCSKLSNITLPQTVTTIKNYAFKNTAIKELEFYNLIDGVMGESVFEGCTSLVRAYFYDTCTLSSIKASTFKNCSSLKSVRLSSSIKTIETYAFNRCSALEGIDFPETLEAIQSYAFMYAFDSNAKPSITIPSSVKEMGYYAFGYSNVSEVYLLGFSSYDNYITNNSTYGDCTFYLCTRLERVVIGSSVEIISKSMFYGSAVLNEIVFENSKNVKYFGERAFEGKSIPEMTVTFGKDVKFIGYRPFYKTTTESTEVSYCPVTFEFEDYSNLILYDTSESSIVLEITSDSELQSAINLLIQNKNYVIKTSI
ncbi:MAG: leucine-rich repeat domain-containing protein [Clostridia bacterium]|nr:leucine-rich repeat domain-containing protein [Clostridia bacterium]